MNKFTIDISYEGDWKEELRIKNCLTYVAENFNELEPIIKEFYIKKEMKKLEKEKDHGGR